MAIQQRAVRAGASHPFRDPPEAADACFDNALNAWVLSRFDDVHAALHAPQLVVHGTTMGSRCEHAVLHRPTARHFGAEHLAMWRPALETLANDILVPLATAGAAELVGEYFEPWALHTTAIVCGLSREQVSASAPDAREIFLAAATATDGRPRDDVRPIVLRLAADLANADAAGVTDASRVAFTERFADVQTFVALTQSVPATLASIWHLLLHNDTLLLQLRAAESAPAASWPTIASELLRIASPARAVFREAVCEISIGSATIRTGDRVVLQLAAANRDVARFPDVDRVAFGTAHVHLALGAGSHRCVGAKIVSLAVEICSSALLQYAPTRAHPSVLRDDTTRMGGFATWAPAELVARLHARPVR